MNDAFTQILTIDELAAFLKLTRRSVYNMTRARGQARMQPNPLPILKINGNVRFRKSDIEAWLARLAGER